ncbi:hypothetical protein KP509_13G062800 [Ceratopteris richardii]|nr:hypothetical protein KP509_13G062800 [Ceratopteris richardii]
MKATETTEQSDLVSAKDTSSLTCLQVDSEDVAGKAGDKSLSSTESEKQGLLRLRSGGAIRPHPEKVKTGGEDAYFIEGDFWIGIADGVGGWARNGIDSGLFSRELMRHCAVIARSMVDEPDPVSVIDKGVEKCEEIGSSTAVVAVLHDQTLHIANIGDSGFIVVRDGKVLTKSKPMQHGFNFPYQIGIDGDDPYDAEEFQVKVASGDVVVLATDGVFDNLYEREIVDLVNQGQAKRVEPGTVALWLVKLAHAAGLNSTGRSPFSDEANAVGYNYSGGKLDDATAVVSYIE